MISRLGAGARSSSSVPRATVGVLSERGRSSSRRNKRGRAVTSDSEADMTYLVRTTASEAFGRALLLHSTRRGKAQRSLARAESDPCRTHDWMPKPP
jgi:hypothetical protein